MAGASHGLVFRIACLATVLTCCVAPRCFSCFSTDTEWCGDRFGGKTTDAHFCDGTCAKYRGERYSNQVRYVEVTRICVAQRSEGCEDTNFNGISAKGCYCNTDFCNAAVKTQQPKCYLLLLSLSLLLALWQSLQLH